MGTNMKSLALILVCTLGIQSVGRSQTTYKVEATKDVAMRLSGTSTLHDWEMVATDVTGEAQFVFGSGSGTDLVSLPSLSFTLKVEDLKSDKKGLDKNAYEALRSNEHKDIIYKLTSSTLSPDKEGYLLRTKGRLTIAGVSKEIAMDVRCVVNANGTITFSGAVALKMTDYDVEPPSFMFGAMSAGDAIKLEFTVIYKKV